MDEARRRVSQMTLQEKAGLCSGSDFWRTKCLSRLGIDSIMMSDGPHGLRKQADGSIEQSELASVVFVPLLSGLVD